ncbi:unnamed protein product [Fraxinus pennsylvanica]|uniref:Uncharacterized protein n=1 Tax=Fraxinus pennsylvanica TaxID=56036 RepID=A0AAD1ZKG2_9LAMI|nr:unnamed protein product [Fraxinus pennsylvanica]
MLGSISEDDPMKFIRIESEELFSSRRLSRELSICTDESFEVYNRDSSVGVPFLWESQPGTPKVKFRENPLPPLTPPPSFHSTPMRNPVKIHSKSSLIHYFLPKISVKKSQDQQSPSSSSPSSSWSSFNSVPSSPFNTPSSREQQRRISSPRMSLHSRIDEDDYGSPTGTLCFSAGRRSNARSRGCPSKIMKLLL